jgi:hypothetical protein
MVRYQQGIPSSDEVAISLQLFGLNRWKMLPVSERKMLVLSLPWGEARVPEEQQ